MAACWSLSVHYIEKKGYVLSKRQYEGNDSSFVSNFETTDRISKELGAGIRTRRCHRNFILVLVLYTGHSLRTAEMVNVFGILFEKPVAKGLFRRSECR